MRMHALLIFVNVQCLFSAGMHFKKQKLSNGVTIVDIIFKKQHMSNKLIIDINVFKIQLSNG